MRKGKRYLTCGNTHQSRLSTPSNRKEMRPLLRAHYT